MKIIEKIFSVKFFPAFFVGYFFLRNIFMPLAYDDYAYAFIWDGEHGGNLDAMQIENSQRERVKSFSDIFISQWSHYFTWGGRVVGHSIAQFFIWQGKIFFDFANTFMLIIFLFVILKVGRIKFRDAKFLLVWIFFNLFFVGAIFGETVTWMTWLTGTCNYFWLSVVQIIFLYQYVKAIRGEKISLLSRFLIFPLALIAGWATEAGSLATVFLTGIFLLKLRSQKNLKVWTFAGFLFLILGCALNIFAPGNFAQLEFIQSINPNFKFSAELFKYHIFHGFLPIILIDLFALLPAIYYFFKRGKNFLMMSFAAAGFLIPCAMMFSPKFELRVTIISVIFILVSSSISISELKIFQSKFFLPMTFILIFYFIPALYANFLLWRENNLQLEYLQRHREENLIVMPKFVEPPNFNLPPIKTFGGIGENEKYCINIMVSQYYKIKFLATDN